MKSIQRLLAKQVEAIKEAGSYRSERVLTSPQNSSIVVNNNHVINFASNNYLGLSNHPRIIEAAKRTLDTHGFGMGSVRGTCGTNDLHQ